MYATRKDFFINPCKQIPEISSSPFFFALLYKNEDKSIVPHSTFFRFSPVLYFINNNMSLFNFNSWGPSTLDHRSMERRMNQLFNHLSQDFPSAGLLIGNGSSSSTATGPFTPAVNVYETDKSWVIRAETPGVRREDIKLDVTQDVITISGETKFSKEYTSGKDHHVRYQECCEGTFKRSLSLPDNIDQDKISAKFENGILEVQLPKTEDTKPDSRKINIE